MNKPIISIIIPTKERCDTLNYVIKTALNQTSNEFEVLISDNFSKDDTKKIVNSFNDFRLKYINTGKRLSMCDSWEFALSNANGKYVMIIGDDDAIMPNSITKLISLINTKPSLIYTWRPHWYIWPLNNRKSRVWHLSKNCNPKTFNLRNRIKFSIEWGGANISSLPMVYHSLVSIDVLNNIKEVVGRVFNSKVPDVYNAFCLAVFVDNIYETGEAYTAHGWSAKSHSGSLLQTDGETIRDTFVSEYDNINVHPNLYPKKEFQFLNTTQDAILTAMDSFPFYYGSMRFNFTAMWALQNKLSGFKKSFWILLNLKKINQYHKVEIIGFIAYSICFLTIYIYSNIKKFINNSKKESWPNNIYDFVNLIKK
jgi:glycosyltransferase involved in cell wall biosynthesis